MQLYASQYIHFLYIITFLDSLLEGLQGFPTLKQIVSLNIGLKHIIIRELCTRGWVHMTTTDLGRVYTAMAPYQSTRVASDKM